MAWPPSHPGTNVVISNSATNIVWGTAGFEVNAFTNSIIKSIKVSERNEQIKIEQASGLTACNVLLLDGLNYDVTVVDDANINWPIGGANVTVIVPQVGVNGASNTATVNGVVINNDYNGARKTEGERVLQIQSFNVIPNP